MRLANNNLGNFIKFENLPHKIKASVKNNKNNENDKYYRLALTFNEKEEPIFLIVIAREKYKAPLIRGVKDDVHISEIARDYDLEIITNDMYFKMQSVVNGLKATSFDGNKVSHLDEIEYLHHIEGTEEEIEKKIEEINNNEKIKNWEQFVISEKKEYKECSYKTGKKRFGIKIDNKIEFYDFDDNDFLENEYKHNFIKPINLEQKFYYQILTHDKNKITVCSGKTGSGKTLIALQAGLSLIKAGKIEGIIYTRNTVTASDQQSEMGYRKGGEKEKLYHFMKPLYNAIGKMIKEMSGKKNYIASDEEIIDFMEAYNIKTMDMAHIRGITIDNELVICDETQNMGIPTLKLTGTRIGMGSRIIYLGDVG